MKVIRENNTGIVLIETAHGVIKIFENIRDDEDDVSVDIDFVPNGGDGSSVQIASIEDLSDETINIKIYDDPYDDRSTKQHNISIEEIVEMLEEEER